MELNANRVDNIDMMTMILLMYVVAEVGPKHMHVLIRLIWKYDLYCNWMSAIFTDHIRR